MATPEVGCGMELLEKRCANCDIFGWEQVDPVVSPLRRCTGCYKVSYCSKECQEEHWHKVHKQHCKYFSGAKSLEGKDLHERDTCTYCILQKEAGVEVFKQDNPNYICLLNDKTPSGRVLLALHEQYPMPSAGSSGTRVERIIDLLQRLLLKIQATKQPVYQLYPKDLEKMSEELSLQNISICLKKATLPQDYQLVGHKSEQLFKLITEDLRKTLPGDLWGTFLLLIDILYLVESVKIDGQIKKPDKSLSKAQRQMSKKVRESSFLQLVDKILEALREKLVSTRELAAIICEDNLQRECSTCKKGIVIQTFESFGILLSRAPFVILGPGLEQEHLFSCGDKACTAQLLMYGGAELRSWTMAISAMVSQLAPSRCDNCFLLAPVQEVHRFHQIH